MRHDGVEPLSVLGLAHRFEAFGHRSGKTVLAARTHFRASSTRIPRLRTPLNLRHAFSPIFRVSFDLLSNVIELPRGNITRVSDVTIFSIES